MKSFANIFDSHIFYRIDSSEFQIIQLETSFHKTFHFYYAHVLVSMPYSWMILFKAEESVKLLEYSS